MVAGEKDAIPEAVEGVNAVIGVLDDLDAVAELLTGVVGLTIFPAVLDIGTVTEDGAGVILGVFVVGGGMVEIYWRRVGRWNGSPGGRYRPLRDGWRERVYGFNCRSLSMKKLCE